MITIERRVGDFKEVSIPKKFGPCCGTQKTTTFQYVCLKCDYKETRDIPIQSTEAWICKRCNI